MIRAVLIDDVSLVLKQMKFLLTKYEEIEILAAFTDPLEALEKMQSLQPDLVFLDIEMPEVNGLFVAEEMMKTVPDAAIVFVTGHDDYAVKAFDVNAIDYILKPLSPGRVDQSIQKILKKIDNDKAKVELQSKISNVRKQWGKRFNKIFALEEGDRIVLLNPADVIMFTLLDREVVVHTREKKYRTRQSLNYWEERLEEESFFRCHKSYLVNFDKVEKISPMFNNTYLLKMKDYVHEIPVSRQKAKQLSQILGL